MIAGAREGQQNLAGMMPSANDVGGAPPSNMDPQCEYAFEEAHRAVMTYVNCLKQARDDVRANQAAATAVKLGDIQLARRAEIAKSAADRIEGKGGNALQAVGGLNAMGVPGGAQ